MTQLLQGFLNELLPKSDLTSAASDPSTSTSQVIITTVVLFIVITIKTINTRKQIGILKAIGVQKEVIMHSYGFQVIILALFGIIIGVTITSLLALYMSIHPIVTPEWSAYLYLTPLDFLVNSLILFGAAVVAGYVPAWRVAQEDIQKSMRA